MTPISATSAGFGAVVALALAALALASCGGSGGATATAPSTATQTQASAPTTTQRNTATSTTPHSHGHHGRRQTRAAPKHRRHHPKPPPVPPGVARTLHGYIAALDHHDGAALCALFVPGALDDLKLPKGSGCSGLSASIGYAGPHGLPVWTHAELQRIENIVTSGGGDVRATARIVDRYRNNPQPSYEDDVIFLAGSGGDWLIEKPSITIYRAIGTPNPPPTVLAAP